MPATPGEQLWVSRYNGPANGFDHAVALGVSPDGSKAFVTGYSMGSTSGFDCVTEALDAATGSKLWVSRYNGPGNDDDIASALGVSPDGSTVFVTGYGPGITSGDDYATVAIDAATGAKLWVSRYNGSGGGHDTATALGISPDGSKVFVAGYSRGITGRYDYATLALDAATGMSQWVERYDGPAHGFDYATALGVSPDGSAVFVTGYSPSVASGDDYATVGIDAATGGALWVSRYNGTASDGGDSAFGLGVSPDGSTVFVTGRSHSTASQYDYATVAIDATTGTKRWVSRYNGPGNSTDSATGLGVSPDGSTVFVTGYSWASSGYDYATVAIDAATGIKQWVSRYNGGTDLNLAEALKVGPNGSTVFVTGDSGTIADGYDYATVAIDAATGSKLWVSRYNGPGNNDDLALAVGVSPDGSAVLVTGSSFGSTSSTDYATVAYSTI